MSYFQICVNFRILGKNGDDWKKREYTKPKSESWNPPTLSKALPNSTKPNALEDLSQVSPISPRRDHSNDVWYFFRVTSPSENNNAQARSHLVQAN